MLQSGLSAVQHKHNSDPVSDEARCFPPDRFPQGGLSKDGSCITGRPARRRRRHVPVTQSHHRLYQTACSVTLAAPLGTTERYYDFQSKRKQLNTCPNFSADPFPKLQTGACAVIAQLCYEIFIQPAKCCVATCRVSTAAHLLLKAPDRGRSRRARRLLTTAAKRWRRPGTSWLRRSAASHFLRLLQISWSFSSRHRVVVSSLGPNTIASQVFHSSQ